MDQATQQYQGPFPGAVLNPNSGEIALNMKQMIEDNMEHSRRRISNDADFDKAMNQIVIAGAQDAATLKHLAAVNLLTASQTGDTENQQTVSPVRTATGDAIVGGVGVSAEQVAANVANLATSLVPVIASALAAAITQSIAALVPVVVNASGGASTPSQTTPKTTSTTS
jgi:hypothetical protein